MPRQSRGYWACDYCSARFDRLEEARYHEQEECKQSPRFAASLAARAMAPPYSGPDNKLAASAGPASAGMLEWPTPTPSGRTKQPTRRFSLLEKESQIMPLLDPADVIACRNLEVFETSAVLEASQRPHEQTQVGLRCVPCAQAELSVEFSLPRTVETLSNSVRNMTTRHLLTCHNLAGEDRRILMQSSQGDQQSWNRLKSFCMARSEQLGIVNRHPENSGIIFTSSASSSLFRATDAVGLPLPLQSETYEAFSSGIHGAGALASLQHHLYGMELPPAFDPMPTTTSSTTPMRSPQSLYPSHEMLPSSFPFFQDPLDGDWLCKYCNHLPAQHRDPHSRWSAATKTPPPGDFIDEHLRICRIYQNEQRHLMGPVGGDGTPSPSYGMSHMALTPQPGWDAHNMPAGPMSMMGGGGMVASSPFRTPAILQHSLHAGAGGFESTKGTRPSRAIDFLTAQDKSGYRNDGTPVSENETLVREEDKLLLTDFLFHLMKQLRLVRFTEGDRKTRGGKREKIQVGYGGLECVHCANHQKARKFFWSGVDRLANSFAEIPSHVFKCKSCPQPVKEALAVLKEIHGEQMARLPRGSQKLFFRRVWLRIHAGDPKPSPVVDVPGPSPLPLDSSLSSSIQASPPDKLLGSPQGTNESEESLLILERPTQEAAKALTDSMIQQSGPRSPSSRVLLAIPEDKDFLSDIDCFLRRQIEVFCATKDDCLIAEEGGKAHIQEGQVGIRCIHCALTKEGPPISGDAVAYPFSINGIYESVREFQSYHLATCTNISAGVKSKLDRMKESATITSIQRKYYVLAARGLGLIDTSSGIRAGSTSVPVVSQAVFSFSEDSPVAAKNPPSSSLLESSESRKRGPVHDAEAASPREHKKQTPPTADH